MHVKSTISVCLGWKLSKSFSIPTLCVQLCHDMLIQNQSTFTSPVLMLQLLVWVHNRNSFGGYKLFICLSHNVVCMPVIVGYMFNWSYVSWYVCSAQMTLRLLTELLLRPASTLHHPYWHHVMQALSKAKVKWYNTLAFMAAESGRCRNKIFASVEEYVF